MSTTPNPMASDLAFIAAAVRRRERRPLPLHTAIIWAMYVIGGYIWVDRSPKTCIWFFLVCWPAAIIATAITKRFVKEESGEIDRVFHRRMMIHFNSIWLAIPLFIAMAMLGQISGMVTGQLCALSMGLIYFLAGAHYNPRFYALGILLMVGSILTPFAPGYGWTLLGILTGAGLILAALIPTKDIEANHGESAR